MLTTYTERRSQIQTYFDRTAAQTWARLTSDAPVSRIRATVRAGRDQMRASLLSYLPADLHGQRVLDAGCGTGAFAIEAARRGAEVLAIDLSPTLVGIARERLPASLRSRVQFASGDMLDAQLGRFSHIVAMDSLIHYRAADMAQALLRLTERCDGSIVFTFAPRTVPLTILYNVGKLFPRGDRAPAIEPISETDLRQRLTCEAMSHWKPARTQRITSGFYKSQAMELVRA